MTNQEIPNDAIKLGARTFLLPNNITHLEADINYTTVYTAKGKHQLISTTLHKVHKCLNDHGHFVRISRKHVVNMDFVETNKRDVLILENGVKLRFSRRMGRRFFNDL
jgi:DNA-binding LytR/AlgR family response regulator